jgi:hypothetical protein
VCAHKGFQRVFTYQSFGYDYQKTFETPSIRLLGASYSVTLRNLVPRKHPRLKLDFFVEMRVPNMMLS